MFYTMVRQVFLHKHTHNLTKKRGNKLQGKPKKRMVNYLNTEINE